MHVAEGATKRKDWLEAVQYGRAVLDSCGSKTPVVAFLEMSRAHRNLFDFDAAESVVRQGLSAYPGDVALLSEFVEIAVDQQDWPEVLKRGQGILDKLRKRSPAPVYMQMGIAHRSHRKQRDFAAAEAIVRKGLARYPGDVKLASELAEVAMKQEDWPEAITRWQAVLDSQGRAAPPNVYVRMSVAHRCYGKFDRAEAIVRKAMADHPNDTELAQELAEIAMAREDWPEALRRWQFMLKQHGESMAVFRGLSIARHHIGDFNGADAALNRSLELEYARPPRKKIPFKHVFKRIDWESSEKKVANAAEYKIRNLLKYVKYSPDPYKKTFSGYLTLDVHGNVIQGKRNPQDRLDMMPFDLAGRSVLDIGCNQGGVLFEIADRIRWGVGIDYDSRLINAANRIRSEKVAHNLDFYTFDLDEDHLPLIRDLMPEPRVDIVFLLAVCAHIKKWEQVIDFAASLSDTMLFEAHGKEWLQLGQLRRLKRRYGKVELIGKAGTGDPSMRTRKLYFCSDSFGG